jgi:hypothetical protein
VPVTVSSSPMSASIRIEVVMPRMMSVQWSVPAARDCALLPRESERFATEAATWSASAKT